MQINVSSILINNRVVEHQTIHIVDGVIKEIHDCNNQQDELSGLLVPGFIDIQVNGGGGQLFNNSPNLPTLKTITKAHQQFGTTGLLPTLITDSVETMQLAADAVAEAIAHKTPSVLGIHFEGPHRKRSGACGSAASLACFFAWYSPKAERRGPAS